MAKRIHLNTKTAIKNSRKSGLTYREIAKKHGISVSSAWRVVNKRNKIYFHASINNFLEDFLRVWNLDDFLVDSNAKRVWKKGKGFKRKKLVWDPNDPLGVDEEDEINELLREWNVKPKIQYDEVNIRERPDHYNSYIENESPKNPIGKGDSDAGRVIWILYYWEKKQ